MYPIHAKEAPSLTWRHRCNGGNAPQRSRGPDSGCSGAATGHAMANELATVIERSHRRTCSCASQPAGGRRTCAPGHSRARAGARRRSRPPRWCGSRWTAPCAPAHGSQSRFDLPCRYAMDGLGDGDCSVRCNSLQQGDHGEAAGSRALACSNRGTRTRPRRDPRVHESKSCRDLPARIRHRTDERRRQDSSDNNKLIYRPVGHWIHVRTCGCGCSVYASRQ